MKILVLGGTRYFGKTLVHQLIQANHEVSIFSRGLTKDDFGDKVIRLVGDRTQKDSMAKAVGTQRYDIVVDQVCMTAADAKAAIDVFQDRTGIYILTSTLSVYPLGGNLKETAFDPFKYQPQPASNPGEQYAEGKRAAENVFATQAPFPWASVRIPVVAGPDDYTLRLFNQVQRIKHHLPIFYPNLDIKFSFIYSDDAAHAIHWLIQKQKTGIYNFAAEDTVTPRKLIQMIEDATGTKAQLTTEDTAEYRSPFASTEDRYLNVEKAKSEGFVAKPLSDWLKPLIDKFANASERT